MSTSMTLNDLEPWKYWFLVILAIFGCKRVNCDEMDRDRPRLLANRNCYRLSRVTWALAQISCYLRQGKRSELVEIKRLFILSVCHFVYIMKQRLRDVIMAMTSLLNSASSNATVLLGYYFCFFPWCEMVFPSPSPFFVTSLIFFLFTSL